MQNVEQKSTDVTTTPVQESAGAAELSQSGGSEAYRLAWLLWTERRFISSLTVVGVLAGILIALLIPSRYTTKTQLMPPDATSGGAMAAIAAGVADKAGGLGTAAADLLGFKSSGALFVGILKSRTVQDRLVDRFDLRSVYLTRYRTEARKMLADRTDISEDRKSGLISIEVTDSSRERARSMAEAYVSELNSVVSTSAMSAAGRERKFIEEQMADVKKQMDESAHALAAFSAKNHTVDLKEQARAMVDAVSTVQGQLIAAQAELKGLQSIYTDSNVRVRSVQARIAELRHQMRQLGGVGAASTSQQPYPNMSQLPELGVTYEDLYRRKKIADAVYEALVQQYEMSKIQEAKDTPKVQMLDAPEPPEIKSFPPRTIIVLACAMLSLCFASGWLIAQDQWATIDPLNPGKQLAQEVSRTIREHAIWTSAPARGVVRLGRKAGALLPLRHRKLEPEPAQTDQR
jgi:capsule polysaccharide export protein KpsE/RkpR